MMYDLILLEERFLYVYMCNMKKLIRNEFLYNMMKM